MFDKQWVMNRENYQKSKTTYAQNPQLPRFVNTLLACRLADKNISLEKFLNPRIEDLSDPCDLEGMTDAVDRIIMAQEAGEKVTIFGDYDCDGITATYVLYHFLVKHMGMQVEYYIPNRLTEGYGMAEASVSQIAQDGTTLMITVDNGIASRKEIELLAQMGVDVIVTDHHKKPEELPECCAVIDPVDLPDSDPHRYLAGCGVAFKLVCALAAELGIQEAAEKYIPAVMIGTIGDSVPLLGDNRIIAGYGLQYLETTKIMGLKALLHLIPSRSRTLQNISSSYILYSIVPKINAAGRLGNSEKALELLLCENERDAMQMASQLIEENTKRQEKESEIATQATDKVYHLTEEDDSVILAYNKNWHHGVIGIVASRLVEKYRKPAFVMAALDESEKLIVGSGRTIDGYNLHSAVSYAKDYLVKFGGHEAACGLTLELDKVRSFIDKINEYSKISEQDAQIPPPNIVIDAIVEPEELTVENINILNKLEPFGVGNPEPVLCMNSLKIERVSFVGADGKHVKIRFSYNDHNTEKKYIDGIAFSKSAYAPLINKIKKAAVVFTPAINTWNGNTEVSLQITDICDGEYSIDNELGCVYNDAYITAGGYTLDRAKLVAVYKALGNLPSRFGQKDMEKIRDMLQTHGINCTWYVLRTAISVFAELGIVKKAGRGMYEIVSCQKVELTSSKIFKSHTTNN